MCEGHSPPWPRREWPSRTSRNLIWTTTYLTDQSLNQCPYRSDQWPNSQFPIPIRPDGRNMLVCSDENWELRIGPLVRSVVRQVCCCPNLGGGTASISEESARPRPTPPDLYSSSTDPCTTVDGRLP